MMKIAICQKVKIIGIGEAELVFKMINEILLNINSGDWPYIKEIIIVA